MSGSKTRFGFAGDGGEPPDSDESRGARTVIGHDIHLRLPSGSSPPRQQGSPTPLPLAPAPAPAPAAWTPVPPARVPDSQHEMTEAMRANRAYRPRQSRLARFIGRWTGSGRFLSESGMKLDADEDIELPRDTTGRNVLLVLLVALFTFSLTFAIVKVRQRFTTLGPDAKGEAPTAALPQGLSPPTSAPAEAAPTAAAPAPLLPPPPVPVPAKAALQPTEPLPPAARGLGHTAPTAPARKPVRVVPRYSAEPPEHLKGELLPISP